MPSLMTPIGTLSYPALFVPKSRVQGGPAEFYQANFIFDQDAQASEEWKAIKAAVKDLISEKFGADKLKDEKFMKRIRMPWRDGSDKDTEGYGPGTVYINPWSKQKPGVVDETGKNEILIASDVWAGQLARATVVPFAYSTQGNMGVSLGLEHVQICDRTTARLDGRRSVKAAFGAVNGASADEPF